VLLLAMDTSTPSVGCALYGPAGPLAERCPVDQFRHAELLAPALADLLAGAVEAVHAVAVGAGPGPFTGLRVGLVTAAALADAWQVPTYTVCSLDALAAGHRHDQPLAAITDARRREVYWAVYDRSGHRVPGPDVGRPADVARQLAAAGVRRIAGAGALAYAEAFAAFDVCPDGPYPTAVAVAELAWPRAAARAPADPLVPLYLRRPDARPPAALR
jgi:tRNA threonylcarbamoyl adenosine modification protein YeaZ